LAQGGKAMPSEENATKALEASPLGTYDFASAVEMVRAVDVAMRQYFGADNWLVIRDREFPGLRPTLY